MPFIKGDDNTRRVTKKKKEDDNTRQYPNGRTGRRQLDGSECWPAASTRPVVFENRS